MYELRGYGEAHFIKALTKLREENPSAYNAFYAIFRSLPIEVSEEDMKYLQQEPVPLKIMIPNIVIEEPDKDSCDHCGYSHSPLDDCLDL